MPQQSYVYACARLSVLSKRLLDSATIKRMAEGSLQDAIRTLADLRYGGMSDVADPDIERLIAKELRDAAEELNSVSPEPNITDLFLLENDMQNLKMLIKARLLDISETEWQAGGLYNEEKLRLCVRDKNYKLLPNLLAERLNAVEKKLDLKVEPSAISIGIDSAYLEYALTQSKKSAFASKYFRAKADFDNVLTFLRLRAMGADKESLWRSLLPEGGIKHRSLMDAYDLSEESIDRILDDSVCRDALLSGLNAMHQTGNMGAVEKARDNYLLSLVSQRRHDSDSFYPIIGYFLAKRREAQAIRLIITAKRNRLPESVITERLVNMYG